MNRIEAEALIRYAGILYPSFKKTEQEIANIAAAWSAEFSNEPKEIVAEAFRLARIESPDWMPSVPQIQSSINNLKTALRMKSKDQEFKDSHCGKSQSEWADYDKWEKSEQGKEKINSFKTRLRSIASGGRHE